MTQIDLYNYSPARFYRWVNISFAVSLLSLLLSICCSGTISSLLFSLFVVSFIIFICVNIVRLFTSDKSAALVINNGHLYIDEPTKRLSLLDIQRIVVEKRVPSLIVKQDVCRWGIEVHLNSGSVYYMKKISDEDLDRIIQLGRQKMSYKEKSTIDVPFSEFASNFAFSI